MPPVAFNRKELVTFLCYIVNVIQKQCYTILCINTCISTQGMLTCQKTVSLLIYS